MERRPKHAQRAAARAALDALPDELLLAVFQLVPEVTYSLRGSAVELTCRGAVERVCHRWRRLALQLPASLTIDKLHVPKMPYALKQIGNLTYAEAAAAAVERLLPHLTCHRITALSVEEEWVAPLAPEVPALLARALYPRLRTLNLSGSSLPHFTSFLPLCRRLEELTISLDDMVDGGGQLVCSHLCGLSCSLQRLELNVDERIPALSRVLARYVQPAVLALVAGCPAVVEWLPQLQYCTVFVQSNADMAHLNSRLEAGTVQQVSQLRCLKVYDGRPQPERQASSPVLAGLPDLPALHKLECHGSVARSTWQCPHLTSLLLQRTPGTLALSAGTVQCTGLRQLHLVKCMLDGGAFPEVLCSTLRQLSSLAVMEAGVSSLPPSFSQLSSLRRLHISGATIKPPSLEAFRCLPGLTGLHLPSCRLEGLPAGPYLSGLRSLDLSGRNPQLASAVPFAATVPRRLQALRISWDQLRPEDWCADVQRKLHCFPGLKKLSLGVGPRTT